MSIDMIKKIGLLVVVLAAFIILIVLLVSLKNKKKKTVKVINKKQEPIKINPNANDSQYISESEESKKEKEMLATPSTQEFLPFDDIRNNMIVLPNNEYKMVIETQSITYNLMSQEEKDRKESRIASALQSWDFDFQIYVQTRETPIEDITSRLKEDYQVYANKFPDLNDYFVQYIREMENSSANRYKNLIKRHFFILTCNDVNYVNKGYSEAEKDEYAFKQLLQKANKMISSLNNVGVVAEILDNDQLIELMYGSLNKEKDFLAKNIRKYLTDFTASEKVIDKPSVDNIVEGFKEQISIALKDPEYSQAERNELNKVLHQLESKNVSTDRNTNDDQLFIL